MPTSTLSILHEFIGDLVGDKLVITRRPGNISIGKNVTRSDCYESGRVEFEEWFTFVPLEENKIGLEAKTIGHRRHQWVEWDLRDPDAIAEIERAITDLLAFLEKR